MSETALNPHFQRLADGRGWWGYLCLDNFDLVADRIRSMLGDGQPYTWVAVNEAFGLRPDVRAGMVAEKVTVRGGADEDTPAKYLTVADTYGVWGIDTSARTEADARDGGKLNNVYLHFETNQWGDKLTIEHYAPAGHRMCWVIAVHPQGGEES